MQQLEGQRNNKCITCSDQVTEQIVLVLYRQSKVLTVQTPAQSTKYETDNVRSAE